MNRSALELDAEPVGQPIYIVEVRNDTREIMHAAVAEALVTKGRQIVFSDRGRCAGELDGVVHEGARPRAEGRRLRIRRERINQRVVVRESPERRPMVLDSIEAIVHARHRDGDGLALGARQLRVGEHDLLVQGDMRQHHFRMHAVNADDVRDAPAPLLYRLVGPLERGVCVL